MKPIVKSLTLSSLLALLFLYTLFPLSVFAEVALPTLDSEPEDFSLTTEQSPAVLTVSATSPDGGSLEYQWYRSETSSKDDASPIEGATQASYTAPVQEGTLYYYVDVWNVLGEERSESVSSRLSQVTYTVPEPPAPEIFKIDVEQTPTKTTYLVGEELDLSGLRVRVYLQGGTELLEDGANVEIQCPSFDTAGKKEVTVIYGEFTDSFTVTVEEEEEPHTHSYGSWKTEKKATCTKDGSRVRECECGEKEYDTLDATGHTYDEGVISKEATAEQSGEILYTCEDCGHTKTESFEMHQHTFGQWVVIREADCTEDGERMHSCSCGFEERETLSKTGHRLDDGVVEVPATEEAEGRMVYTCSLCGETNTKTIAKLPSVPVGTDPLPTPPSEETTFPWWNVASVLVILSALAAGGVFLYFEKKPPTQKDFRS